MRAGWLFFSLAIKATNLRFWERLNHSCRPTSLRQGSIEQALHSHFVLARRDDIYHVNDDLYPIAFSNWNITVSTGEACVPSIS